MRSRLLLFLGCCFPAYLFCQAGDGDFSLAESKLGTLAMTMQESPSPEERVAAAEEMHRLLGQLLRMSGSWDYPFGNVPPLSVQDDPDGRIRLFSWQVMGEPGQFLHFGYLQTKARSSEPVPLESRGHEMFPSAESERRGGDWLGQIYYRILPFQHKGERHWVLFGFSSGDGLNSRKIAEILRLEKDGGPVFGTPLFRVPDGEGREARRLCRIVLDYAAESQVSLNFDPGLEMILFDHLTPYADGRSGSRMRYIPDGTYSGYRLKRGQWHFVEQLANETLDEAPVPTPVLDSRKGRDIMGRDRK